jgi:hypothetical protein
MLCKSTGYHTDGMNIAGNLTAFSMADLLLFRRVRKIAKKATISLVMFAVRLSVRPHGTIRLPVGVFHEI